MNTTKFFAVAALATAAAVTSIGAFADVEDGSAYALKFEGNRTRAEVRAEAIEQARNHDVRPGDNVGQGVQKGSDRAAVRAETVQAVRLGLISSGEATYQ